MEPERNFSKNTIVYITTGLSTGGAERMLYNLLSKINKERFSPVVVSLLDRGTWGDRIEALGIPVHTVGMKPGMLPTPYIMWRLINLLRQLQPALIQGWMYHGNLAAQVASWFCLQPPVLWSIHHSINFLSSEKKTTVAIIKSGAQLSRFVQSIVFVSQISKIQHEKLGYSSHNSCVIPNGFDTALFIPSSEAKLNVRKELGLPENTNLIGLICRYHPMKDHANFLRAVALISKERPNVQFVLVGTEVEPKNHTLNQLIQDLRIDGRVHLLGERKDIPRLIAALDILSSSSAYGEAFPLVVGEAMSCGVPCVVTDVGDSGWIVGNTGLVVPSRNPEALANAWKELIDLGTEGRAALGKAARERIIECFALDSVVARYEQLYENLLIATPS